tara:strand:+ start:444 stop:1046 length:603 start_codon:yes stop_codon:yes gene_type:complete
MANISSFLSKIGEGVKPNMFSVEIPFPAGLDNEPTANSEDQKLVNLLCKSTALPASNLGVIEVPFRGRTVKIAGDRTFDTWSATFFNDKDMKVRGFFEQWLESINTHEANNAPLFQPSATDGYMQNMKVHQLRKDTANPESPNKLRSYELYFAFPTSISQIDLAYDSNDQIEEFTVEFQYSYWKALKGGTTGSSQIEIKK